MSRTVLSALFSYWRRHLFQLGALIIGLALATALWAAVQAVNAQARASYAKAESYLAQAEQRSLRATTAPLRVADYVRLKRLGWKLSPVLQGRWRNSIQNLDIIGIDPLTSPQVPGQAPPSSAGGETPLLLALLQPPGGMIMHPETAGMFGSGYDAGFGHLQIIRSEAVPVGLAVADISLASRLLGSAEQLTRLVLLEDVPLDREKLVQLPAHIQLASMAEAQVDPGSLTESFHLNLTAFGFLSFAVGLFIVQGMISLAMEQRRNMFRTLRCLGVPFVSLLGLLAVEMGVIAFISASIGLIIGHFIAIALLPGVSITLASLYGAQVEHGLSLRANWILSGLAMSFLGTALASAQSFYSLWKLPILLAPSTQARGQQLAGRYGAWALAGLALLAAGSIALMTYGGLLGGFVFLGGLMLGAALMLPFCLWQVLHLGQSLARGALAQWLWADARAQLPGLSLALMALMLALATNIGVGTMVSSFRLTFSDWMDQRLSAELYVTAQDDDQGAALQIWLEGQGHRVLPIRSHELQRQSGPLRIYGVRDDATYRENWPMLEARDAVWDKIAMGAGLLVSEQLARRENLRLGDHLPLPDGWPGEILGIYSDYGNPQGQAITSLAKLLDNAPGAPNRRFGIRLPVEEVPDLINVLMQEFDLKRENLVQQSLVKSRSMAVFNQTFLVTDALKLLTLGVASFAIFTSLVSLWSQRLPQLGPVWAMGVSRRVLALLDIFRSLLMAALTALLALPLGLILSWALLDVINTEAFGWHLPMYMFPFDWLRLVLLSLLAAFVAALIPAWHLFQLHPNELLKVFSSER